jgi:hypothetical protein
MQYSCQVIAWRHVDRRKIFASLARMQGRKNVARDIKDPFFAKMNKDHWDNYAPINGDRVIVDVSRGGGKSLCYESSSSLT